MRHISLTTICLGMGLGISQAVSAIPINGAISFSDGFHTTGTDTSIVSQLTVMDVNGNANASGCTDSFGAGCSNNGDYALVFDITSSSGQLVFNYGGFQFTAGSFGAPDRTSLTCDNRGNCSDAISFAATGQVTGGAFDSTPFTMLWSAAASCRTNSTRAPIIACGADTISAHWSATVLAGDAIPTRDAILVSVPEPGSLALIGVSLALLGAVTRRRS